MEAGAGGVGVDEPGDHQVHRRDDAAVPDGHEQTRGDGERQGIDEVHRHEGDREDHERRPPHDEGAPSSHDAHPDPEEPDRAEDHRAEQHARPHRVETQGVGDEERSPGQDQRHRAGVGARDDGDEPELLRAEDGPDRLEGSRLATLSPFRVLPRGQGDRGDDHGGDRAEGEGCGRVADGIGDERCEGHTDDDGHEHESLPEPVDAGPGPLRGEQLRQERAVVRIDHRVDRLDEDREEGEPCDEGGGPCVRGRVEERHQADREQRCSHEEPGAPSTPPRPGPVGEVAVHRVVDGVDDRVGHQDGGDLGGRQDLEFRHVVETHVREEHVDRQGRAEHADRVAPGAGRGLALAHLRPPGAGPAMAQGRRGECRRCRPARAGTRMSEPGREPDAAGGALSEAGNVSRAGELRRRGLDPL